MPKERRSRSKDHRCRASPLRSTSSCSASLKVVEDDKKWEDVRCPVCMEHPHNAVLLQCSSRDQGCHAFMCDTSYRHSNCLDLYRKSFSNKLPEEEDNVQLPIDILCPLCRGHVTGWTVIESARKYMNARSRSCSLESCSFTGVYGELREHARKEHPSARPSEADPERQQDWRRMERQRDLGDLFSMFHSPVTREHLTNDEEAIDSFIGFSSITMVLVVHVHQLRANSGVSTLPPSSRSRTSFRQSSRAQRARRVIRWGEPLLSNARAVERVPSPGYQAGWIEPSSISDDDDNEDAS
ncbi:uncharacterized protein LOC122006064 [Zingiber officinale]|uniref:Uncharacterized protein n=1 Tax=Zingiber officinale TaxID=94328 RepID=A0A8J5FMC7_ZINOF|nr:uncharacterized protein LOC122006064 [Zingiber officinale]KAG6489938.1 hypothetical protein ZIOFF_051219 [Zingiber officinale]